MSWNPHYDIVNECELICHECRPPIDSADLDTMVRNYAECALWSSSEYDEDGNGGEPLDTNYTIDDIHPNTMASMREDCESFLRENMKDIGTEYERAGHDFWLTRNGHGAGFWDGDWDDEIGNRLTKSAHSYGSIDLYVGNDGMIHS